MSAPSAAPRRDASTPARPRPALPGFLLLYGALYAAYGTESAYMPAFLRSHGLPVERVGVVLAAGTAMRILAGPLIGRQADRLGARKGVLGAAATGSGLIGMAYGVAFGFPALLLTSMAHAAATASLAPLADALAVAASQRQGGFAYGWVRGAGSAAFVGGTLLSGQLVDRFGLGCIIAASSVLFLAMAACVAAVQAPASPTAPEPGVERGAFSTLWAIRAYRRLIVIVVLVIGSHAMNDAFAVIQWRAAGFSAGAVSLLWSESVVAEVVVFFLAGPWLLARLGPARAATLSAAAGVLRWGVLGSTDALPALVAVQALHGLTFALLHLVAMNVIGRSVPDRLSATAQSLYGTFALGLASATLTLASGYLFEAFGARAFWAMAACCVAALPVAVGLRQEPGAPGR